MKLPPGAKKESTRLRWWQPEHGGRQVGDWVIDGVRVNGEEVNPNNLTLNFTSDIDFRDVVTVDNMEVHGQSSVICCSQNIRGNLL